MAFAQRNDVLVDPWTVKLEEAAREQSKTRFGACEAATKELHGSRTRSFPEEKPSTVARAAGRQLRKLDSSWGSPRCLAPVDEDDRKIRMHKPREGGCTRQARRMQPPDDESERMHTPCPTSSPPSSEADTARP